MGIIMLPFTETKSDNKLFREFSTDVAESELCWHRDKKDRYIKILEGENWLLQMDNCLPIEMVAGDTFFISKETYHRIFKGTSNLKIEIIETD